MIKYYIYIFIILIICLLLAFCIWGIIKKKQGICPLCILKQHICKSKLTINIPKDKLYDGGNALTPPMGWSSWNTFRNHIDENLVLETADALVETGLAEAGYVHVNLDDCWQSSVRDENGRLQGDLGRFSSGIGWLSDEIRKRGLKIGLYTSNGDYTCEDLPASLGNEKIDAETFASWGVEYFKYDFCHNIKIPSIAPLIEAVELKQNGKVTLVKAEELTREGMARINKDKKLKTGKYISFLGHGKGKVSFIYNAEDSGECSITLCVKKCGRYEKYVIIQINESYYEITVPFTKSWSPDGRYQIKINVEKGDNVIKIYNPVCTRADSAYIQYKRMGEELKKASNGKITYSICEWGRNNPENWAWNAGNLWRISQDITTIWSWINVIYNMNLKLSEFASPGHWNDPDMLEVGNGNLTYEENKTHFSLWCMMSAPLILGNDIRKLPDEKKTLDIISNKDMIAINQDKLGMQCVRYKKTSTFDFLVKKLADGKCAVCIYNKKNSTKNIQINKENLPSEIDENQRKIKEIWTKSEISYGDTFTLKGHGCAVFITI